MTETQPETHSESASMKTELEEADAACQAACDAHDEERERAKRAWAARRAVIAREFTVPQEERDRVTRAENALRDEQHRARAERAAANARLAAEISAAKARHAEAIAAIDSKSRALKREAKTARSALDAREQWTLREMRKLERAERPAYFARERELRDARDAALNHRGDVLHRVLNARAGLDGAA